MSRSNLFPRTLPAVPWRPVAAIGMLLLLGITIPSLHAQESDQPQEIRTPLDDEGRLVDFERDVAPILRERCLECHGPDDAKNDFRVDDADLLSIYIDAGDGEFSPLYLDYLASEDEDMLMPPPSHGGPLSPAELSLIRVWIDEGANWPEEFELVAAEGTIVEAPLPAETASPPRSLAARLWAFQGYFHPAIVHFPIALLLLGAMFVVLGLFKPSIGTQIPLACLLIGSVSAVIATLMGWSFATQQGYGGWATFDLDSDIFWHRWSAVAVAGLSMMMAIVAVVAARRASRALTVVWKVGLLVLAGMVALVGHQGGELTYGSTFYQKAFAILYGESDEPVEEAAVEGEEELQADPQLAVEGEDETEPEEP